MDSGHCCMDGVDWTCCIGGCGGREVVIRRQGGRLGGMVGLVVAGVGSAVLVDMM